MNSKRPAVGWAQASGDFRNLKGRDRVNILNADTKIRSKSGRPIQILSLLSPQDNLQEQTMSTQGELQIDSSHCRAICDEIGERLRAILARDSRRCRLTCNCLWIDLRSRIGSWHHRSCLHRRHVWRPKSANRIETSLSTAFQRNLNS